jgi:hypothetical protein
MPIIKRYPIFKVDYMSKKYLLFIVIAAVVSVSLAAQSDKLFATRIEIRDGQKFLVITGYNGNEKSVTIPASINNIPVRKIDASAFRLKGLTGVVLPNGLESIGEQAFQGNKLSIVNIPPSVKVIADSAFDSNILKDVTNGRTTVIPTSSYMVTKSAVTNTTDTNTAKESVKVYYIASDNNSQKVLDAGKEDVIRYDNFYNPLTGYDGIYKPVLNSSEEGRPVRYPSTGYPVVTSGGAGVKPATVPDGRVVTEGSAASETAKKGESSPQPAGKFAGIGKSQGYAIVTNTESGVGKFAYRNRNLDSINIPEGTTYIG